MEDSVHSIVLHVGPNPGNPSRKSDLALGFFQGKIFLVHEAFHAVLCDGGSAAKVIRPPDLYGLFCFDGESIATTNPTRLVIMTTNHACGSIHSCRYIHLKIKRASSKVTLTHLKIVIDL